MERDQKDFVPPKEAPVYRPEPEDFDDPFEFINKIRPVAEKYGICRIVPPDNWRPPFSVNLDKFSFNPRVQHLKELEATTRIKLHFLQELSEFWIMQGTSLKIPSIANRLVDLHALHQLVQNAGGYGSVTSSRKWAEIATKLGLPDPSSSVKILRGIHRWRIFPFLKFVAFYSGKKRRRRDFNKPPAKMKASPCKMFCKGLISFWRKKGRMFQWPILERKSVDLYTLNLEAVRGGEVGEVDWLQVAENMTFERSPKNAETLRNVYNFMIKPFVESGPVLNEPESSSEEDSVTDEDGMVCSICRQPENKVLTLTCVQCATTYHSYCLKPIITVKVKGPWHCYDCTWQRLSKLREPYGFSQSARDYTLQQFGEMAVKFKEEHFGMPALDVPTAVVEKEYWRILSSFEEDITVEYGADVQSSKQGAGFPLKSNDHLIRSNDQYAKSKWNLNNIPVSESSVYSYIGTNIPGVTLPWIYVGMCFSTFCWHIEDHWSYSINYLHWGEPKTWYSIPGSEAEDFERVLKTTVGQLFQGQPDLLHDLSTTVNPNLLMSQGISLCRTDQRAGEFVVTFPRAYHAGFNQGFNFAEAVNFAPADWIHMGRLCIDHYSNVFHCCVFSHDELICKMAVKAFELNGRLARAALTDMAVMLRKESALRKEVEEAGVCQVEQREFENIPDDSRQCTHCKTTCFLSAIYCPCNTKLFCLRDFNKVKESCACPKTNLIFVYRYKLDALLSLIESLYRIQTINEPLHPND